VIGVFSLLLLRMAAASCAIQQTKMNNVEHIRWIRHMVISVGTEKREILDDGDAHVWK
jgi:hypothetical protein